MDSNKRLAQNQSPSRRKFVYGVGLLSVFTMISAAIRFPFSRRRDIISCAPIKKSNTVKMLGQDGKLVEIDASLITANKKKITDKELQSWVKKSTNPFKTI